MAQLFIPPVLAQGNQTGPLPGVRPVEPPEIPPEQIHPCNPGDYVPSPELELPDVPPAIDCGPVIVPPTGLDHEIREPLPEDGAGSIRVIPPSEIEPQN